jgi:signal transduction histidine kinase
MIAAALALVSTITALLYGRLEFYDDPAPIWLSAIVIAALNVPLAARRRYPEIVAVIVSVAFFAAQHFYVPEPLISSISLFVALYTVGAWGQNRSRATVVRVAITVGMFIWIAVSLNLSLNDPEFDFVSRAGVFSQFAAYAVIQVLTNLMYFGGAYYFGSVAYAAARERFELDARTTELAKERELSAAQAIALDRVSIARELHDVVAHHVSVMGVQAGAARRVVSSNPAQASSSLEQIELSAREAIAELHRLLTTLRAPDTDAASESSSTRGIEQIPDLLADFAPAGVGTTLRTIGEPRPLSALISFTLYRVAQEALTNTRKHAGACATVDVRLRYTETAVELEVVDTGQGVALGNSSTGPAGLGQTGMRERVGAVGGSLTMGPRSRGGYLVRATIPLTRELVTS